MAESVYVQGSTGHSQASDLLRASYLGNAAPVAWTQTGCGIAAGMVVSGKNCGDPLFQCEAGTCHPNDLQLPGDCPTRRSSTWYALTPLACGYQQIGDKFFLWRAENSLGGPADHNTSEQDLIDSIVTRIRDSDPFYLDGYAQWSNFAVMLGLVQD